jgi:hypothetical protein
MNVDTASSAHAEATVNGPRATRDPDRHDGIFGTWIALWVGMMETTVRTSGRFSKAAIGETQKAVDATIDWTEETQQALFRTIRQANRAAFELASEVVGRSEQAALVVLRQSQSTGDRASELAAQASHAMIGSRGVNGAAAR